MGLEILCIQARSRRLEKYNEPGPFSFSSSSAYNIQGKLNATIFWFAILFWQRICPCPRNPTPKARPTPDNMETKSSVFRVFNEVKNQLGSASKVYPSGVIGSEGYAFRLYKGAHAICLMRLRKSLKEELPRWMMNVEIGNSSLSNRCVTSGPLSPSVKYGVSKAMT